MAREGSQTACDKNSIALDMIICEYSEKLTESLPWHSVLMETADYRPVSA